MRSLQMARPHAYRVTLVEQWRKEGQTGNMVEVRMGEIYVDIQRRQPCQLETEGPDARARIEDQPAVPGSHLEAGGIAAIAGIFGAGTRDRSPYAPESDFQTVGQRLVAPVTSAEGQSPQAAGRVNHGDDVAICLDLAQTARPAHPTPL